MRLAIARRDTCQPSHALGFFARDPLFFFIAIVSLPSFTSQLPPFTDTETPSGLPSNFFTNTMSPTLQHPLGRATGCPRSSSAHLMP